MQWVQYGLSGLSEMTFKPSMIIYSDSEESAIKQKSEVYYDKRRKAWVVKWEGYKDTVLYMDGRIKHDKRMRVIRQ